MGVKESEEYRKAADEYLKILYAPYDDYWVYNHRLLEAADKASRLIHRIDDGTS